MLPCAQPLQTRVYNAIDGTWYNATVNYTVYGNWTRTITKQVAGSMCWRFPEETGAREKPRAQRERESSAAAARQADLAARGPLRSRGGCLMLFTCVARTGSD